MTFKLTVDL